MQAVQLAALGNGWGIVRLERQCTEREESALQPSRLGPVYSTAQHGELLPAMVDSKCAA